MMPPVAYRDVASPAIGLLPTNGDVELALASSPFVEVLLDAIGWQPVVASANAIAIGARRAVGLFFCDDMAMAHEVISARVSGENARRCMIACAASANRLTRFPCTHRQTLPQLLNQIRRKLSFNRQGLPRRVLALAELAAIPRPELRCEKVLVQKHAQSYEALARRKR